MEVRSNSGYSYPNGQWVVGTPGFYRCQQCGQQVPIVYDLPHQCPGVGFVQISGTSTTIWTYVCGSCGQTIVGGSFIPPHVCPGAAASADGPEECTLCFSLVRRGKMSDHWMNLHHAPQPGVDPLR